MGSKSGGEVKLSSQEKELISQQTDLLKDAQGIVKGGYKDFQAGRDQLFDLAGFSRGPGGEITPTGSDKLGFAKVPTTVAGSAIPGQDSMPRVAGLNRQVFDTLTKNINLFDPNRPDPFVEEQLRKVREAETERLQSRLGPGADVSSAGLESLQNLSLNEILSRDAARRQNYADQLQQFQTLGTLGLQTSGELFNRKAGLRNEEFRKRQEATGLRQETNQNILANEGFRQQRLSDLSNLLQQPLSFAGPLGGVAQGFGSPLAAYAGARTPYGPSGGQQFAGAAGGALAGAGAGATLGSVVPGIGTAIGAAGGALIGGVGGWMAGG